VAATALTTVIRSVMGHLAEYHLDEIVGRGRYTYGAAVERLCHGEPWIVPCLLLLTEAMICKS